MDNAASMVDPVRYKAPVTTPSTADKIQLLLSNQFLYSSQNDTQLSLQLPSEKNYTALKMETFGNISQTGTHGSRQVIFCLFTCYLSLATYDSWLCATLIANLKQWRLANNDTA